MRRWLSRGNGGNGGSGEASRSEEARLHWNRALSTLVAWRATHRARAAAYLVPAGGSGDAPRRGTTGGTASYGKKKEEKKRSESGSGDENAAPTPPSVLRPSSSSSEKGEDEQTEEELEIRASFNRLMDGRIARTRASSIDGIRSGFGGGEAGTSSLSDLFPRAA